MTALLYLPAVGSTSGVTGERLTRNGATATSLTLRFLGTPEVLVAGDPLHVDTRKATALLAFVAVEGQQRRERLASMLWPDSDRARARSALRRTLSVTAKALGGRFLDVEGDGVELARGDVDCDTWLFDGALNEVVEHGDDGTCTLCLERLERAVALRRGDFLGTFSLRDSPDFDDWQLVQDERIRRQACGAMDQLIRGHMTHGDLETAGSFAERRLLLDPLHERAHRQLMLLHAWRGRRSDAVQQYRTCLAVLQAELGVSPLEETTALYERIVAGDIPPQPSSTSHGPVAPSSGARTDPRPRPVLPLVGRSDELRLALDRLESAGSDGHVLVIEGEAGIGKSRLADEVASHAGRHGAVVLTARCHDDERRLPHAPVVELLRASAAADPASWSRLAAEDLAALSRLVPELTRLRKDLPAAAPLDTSSARTRFHEAIGRALTPAASTMIVVDDAHFADRASLALLAHLARHLHGRRIHLVLAWRPEATSADRTLRRLLSTARDDDRATVISLGRLRREHVDQLVRSALPARAEETTERLFAETEGLPLLIVEFLAALASHPEDWRLPAGARDRLLSRLESVRGVARQVLATAAVIGRAFDVDLVQRASGRTVDETEGALEQLVGGGLLRELVVQGDVRPRFDFGHTKLRQLAYEQIRPARRRLLHGRVASAMSARVRGELAERGVAALLAHHERLAGRDKEAAVHHRMAAEHARAVLAFDEAGEHLEAALALGDPDVAGLHEGMGDLHTLKGDYAAALGSLETAAAHLMEDASRRAAVEHKLAGVHLRRGDRLAAGAHLGAALHLIGNEGVLAERARLVSDQSLAALRSHDHHEAESLAAEALELAGAAHDLAALAQAHNLLAMVARSRNQLDDARGHASSSLELAIAMGDVQARVAAMNNLGLVERAAGRPDAAVELHRQALELCRTVGDRHREAALANNLADALYAAGRRDEAMSNLKDAVARFAEISDPDVMRPEIWKLVDW